MSNNNEKIWLVAPAVADDVLKDLSDYHPLIVQILYNRGIKGKKDVEFFLNAEYPKNALDPFLFNYMARAVDLIISHIKKHNKIAVYGDYDADGVTSSAILYETLTIFKGYAQVYIPDRVSEGYGLNNPAIDQLLKEDIKLIITTDNGIRNKAEAAYAASQGVDVIITDHHVPPPQADLPECLIINPLREGEKFPFKYLAGVGVAFKLAVALIAKSKLSDEDKAKLETRLLDLAAIGTVADMVTLTGENRLIAKKGLEILNSTNRIGLLELIKAAGMKKEKYIDSWNIGFQIGPRLNAAGRMEHANTAFEILTTKDKNKAEKLARELNASNQDRQKITEEILVEAEKQINPEDKLLIAIAPICLEPWKEGVIGLVAGKIAQKYYRPALIITNCDDEYKGSGRSIEEFNIINAVAQCADLLDKYGGHAQACGFGLKKENLDGFIAKIKNIAAMELNKSGIDLKPKIKIDSFISLNDIDENLVKELEKLAPFGQDNERPVFMTKNIYILDILNMGSDGQHIKLRVKSEDSRVFSVLGFGQSEALAHLSAGDRIDLVYYIEINEFNGKSDMQLKIVDIKLHNS